VTTPEKVVPSLEDALNVVKLQTYLSTGKIVSSFVNIITGPSYTADIEKRILKGMHGPREVVIVMVDGGRLSAADKEPQYCIGCGMCLLHCPVYNVVGPFFGSHGHMGGLGAWLSGSVGKLSESLDAGLNMCTECGACTEVCPSSIEVKKGISRTREQVRDSEKGGPPEHDALISSVRNYDNPWMVPRKQKAAWAEGLGLPDRGELLYFVGCSTALLSPGTAQAAVRILRHMGHGPAFLGQKEKCCGSTLRKVGEPRMARKKAEECFRDFKAAGARTVITSCPGCASALARHRDLLGDSGIDIVHISQFLDKHLDRDDLSVIRRSGKATFHDPCDLGRELGVYEEPRRLSEAVLGKPISEMDRFGANSACCGSGAGVKSAFPELSRAIASDRVNMARKAGAEIMVTSCPWCVQSLRECQGADPKVEVVDLVDLVDESLSKAAKRGRSDGHRKGTSATVE
jgi:Fe-S oxidoreductase